MVTREVYQEKFGQDLKEVLNKFTSGPFQLLTLMVVDKLRVEFGQLSVRIDGGYKLYKTQTPTPVCCLLLAHNICSNASTGPHRSITSTSSAHFPIARLCCSSIRTLSLR